MTAPGYSTFSLFSDWTFMADSREIDFQLLEPAIDDRLLEFEIGNSESEQATDTLTLLEDRHPMTCAAELLRGGQSGGAGAHHGH